MSEGEKKKAKQSRRRESIVEYLAERDPHERIAEIRERLSGSVVDKMKLIDSFKERMIDSDPCGFQYLCGHLEIDAFHSETRSLFATRRLCAQRALRLRMRRDDAYTAAICNEDGHLFMPLDCKRHADGRIVQGFIYRSHWSDMPPSLIVWIAIRSMRAGMEDYIRHASTYTGKRIDSTKTIETHPDCHPWSEILGVLELALHGKIALPRLYTMTTSQQDRIRIKPALGMIWDYWDFKIGCPGSGMSGERALQAGGQFKSPSFGWYMGRTPALKMIDDIMAGLERYALTGRPWSTIPLVRHLKD